MKAVVLETRGKEAAVLAGDGTVRIVRGSHGVGDVIELKPSARPVLRRWAAAAAAAAIAVLGAGAGFWADRNYTARAEVSLDVNPSIVYTLNKRDRVLSVRAANEQAQAVVEALEQSDIRFAPLSDAVERTMALLEDEGYLTQEQEDYVLVNVSTDDEARQARLTDAVAAAMARVRAQDATLEYRIDHSDRQTASDASANGMSPGRYALWQQSGEAAGKVDEADMRSFAEAPVQALLAPSPGDAPDESDRQQPGNPGDGDPSPRREAPSDAPPNVKTHEKNDDAAPKSDPIRGNGEEQQDIAQQGDKPSDTDREEAGPSAKGDDAAQPQQDRAAESPGEQNAPQPHREKRGSEAGDNAAGKRPEPERKGKQPSGKQKGKSSDSGKSPGGQGKGNNPGRGK